MNDFDVLLVTHNHLELTIGCLEGTSLSKGLYKNTADFQFRLTVLDDSDDLTPQYFKRLCEDKTNVQYINPGRPFKNIDEIYNMGLAHTECPFVATLNNSCLVEPGWIGSALQIMKKDARIGAVGFKTVKPSGLIENAGVVLYGGEARNIGLDDPGHRYSFVYKVDAVGASACLFRREAIKDGFNFNYYLPFGGYEDIDCCLELKFKKGWEIIYCGYGAVYHDGARTRGEDPAFWDKFNENKRRFAARWQHLLDRDSSVIKMMQ